MKEVLVSGGICSLARLLAGSGTFVSARSARMTELFAKRKATASCKAFSENPASSPVPTMQGTPRQSFWPARACTILQASASISSVGAHVYCDAGHTTTELFAGGGCSILPALMVIAS